MLTDQELQSLRNMGNEAEAAADEIERMREALTELRDRIKGHPAYADLTEAEEIDAGGDTAELSYLARVADATLGPNVRAQALPEGEACRQSPAATS